MSEQTMHSAIITSWGEAPKYTKVPMPIASEEEVAIQVIASGLHNTVLSRASGKHYSSGSLPHTPGVDGVGRRISDDKLVYFITLPRGGGFQEIVNVQKRKTVLLLEGVDPIQVAAYANPVVSSWMALKTRVANLPENFTVLIMGATSASGSLAVDVCRALGAGKVVGMARNVEALKAVGPDEMIVLDEKNIAATDCSTAANVDIVLDYISGTVAEHLLSTTRFTRPSVQYVHIGGLGGTDNIAIPGAALRSQNLTIRGSGTGSWTHAELAEQVPAMLEAFKDIKPKKVNVVSLSKIEECWNMKSQMRTVFSP